MKILISFFIITLLSTYGYARPKAVILIRHAEEPKEDVNYLSPIGHQRAQEMHRLFTENSKLKELGNPIVLFAAGTEKPSSSIRSIQTLTPLANFLKLTVNDSFVRDDYKALAQEILNNKNYNDKVVMLCWQHKKMPMIAELIGVAQPPKSPGNKYDRLWLVTYDSKGKGSLVDLPQKLLPGDDTK
jgi:hypothetical protein